MAANTFSPGPTPNTVPTADGRVLTAPEGWALLPPGDAALTRRVKATGDHWVVQEKKGRKVFSRGVWAPAATIHRIRGELEAERSTEGYAKRKETPPSHHPAYASVCRCRVYSQLFSGPPNGPVVCLISVVDLIS